MGFHNKSLPLPVKGKSGGVEADAKDSETQTDNYGGVSLNFNIQTRGGPSSGEARDLTSNTEMTMIERKIRIIEDLEAFQQALPLFSSMEHHAVHIQISDDGEPTLFECICGEEVLKEIQFLRHLIYQLGAMDLRNLSHFVKTKIEILTKGKMCHGQAQEKAGNRFPSSNCNKAGTSASARGSGGVVIEEMDSEVVEQPSLLQENQDQDLPENTAPPTVAPLIISKKERKKKKKGTHKKSKKSSGKKKNPKFFYWQKRNGHGIKSKITAGENEGMFICYCGGIFKRLSSIDHHVNKKWNRREFKCEESGCSNVYLSKFRLKLHFEKSHKKDPLAEDSPSGEGESQPSEAASVVTTPSPSQTSSSSSPGSARARPKAKSKKKVSETKTTPKKVAIPVTPGTRVSARRKLLDSKNNPDEMDTSIESIKEPEPVALPVRMTKLQLPCPKPDCGKIFISKKGLRLHIQAQHDKIPVICKKCGVDVKYETCLLAHQRSNKCRSRPKDKVAILSLLKKESDSNPSSPVPLALVVEKVDIVDECPSSPPEEIAMDLISHPEQPESSTSAPTPSPEIGCNDKDEK